MNRFDFLALLGTAVHARPERSVEIPVVLRGGRFFAVPRTLDGRIFRCWLDSDGSGFIFEDAARSFRLPVLGKRASLPRFRSHASIPPLSRNELGLAIFSRSSDDRSNPILQDFEAQLGGTWFADRIWVMDSGADVFT